jgi:hypothetical protein
MARKVLGFKSVHCDPPHFHGNLLVLYLGEFCLLHFHISLFYFWDFLWASIQLIDVNEVVIIIIFLGEPQHPNFRIIITSELYTWASYRKINIDYVINS